jgi:hypothetical protein
MGRDCSPVLRFSPVGARFALLFREEIHSGGITMFRLIKLAVYALLGYAIYEIYLGMTGEGSSSGGRRSRDLDRALNRDDEGRMGALTGPGVGHEERTLDLNGTSIPHQVGRGVITH